MEVPDSKLLQVVSVKALESVKALRRGSDAGKEDESATGGIIKMWYPKLGPQASNTFLFELDSATGFVQLDAVKFKYVINADSELFLWQEAGTVSKDTASKIAVLEHYWKLIELKKTVYDLEKSPDPSVVAELIKETKEKLEELSKVSAIPAAEQTRASKIIVKPGVESSVVICKKRYVLTWLPDLREEHVDKKETFEIKLYEFTSNPWATEAFEFGVCHDDMLVLGADKRTLVRCLKTTKEAWCLGFDGYASGVHCWEVDKRNLTDFKIGVCNGDPSTPACKVYGVDFGTAFRPSRYIDFFSLSRYSHWQLDCSKWKLTVTNLDESRTTITIALPSDELYFPYFSLPAEGDYIHIRPAVPIGYML